MKYTAKQTYDKMVSLDFGHGYCKSRGIIDINEHLETIRQYALLCDHATEFGTRCGVSLYSFIVARVDKVVTYDINADFIAPYKDEIVEHADEMNVAITVKTEDVLDCRIEPTDLLFIDSYHSYSQLSKELSLHAGKVNKYIILHDTVTFGYQDERPYRNHSMSNKLAPADKQGLQPAISEFLESNSKWQIAEVFKNNNGLTILENAEIVS